MTLATTTTATMMRSRDRSDTERAPRNRHRTASPSRSHHWLGRSPRRPARIGRLRLADRPSLRRLSHRDAAAAEDCPPPVVEMAAIAVAAIEAFDRRPTPHPLSPVLLRSPRPLIGVGAEPQRRRTTAHAPRGSVYRTRRAGGPSRVHHVTPPRPFRIAGKRRSPRQLQPAQRRGWMSTGSDQTPRWSTPPGSPVTSPPPPPSNAMLIRGIVRALPFCRYRASTISCGVLLITAQYLFSSINSAGMFCAARSRTRGAPPPLLVGRVRPRKLGLEPWQLHAGQDLRAARRVQHDATLRPSPTRKPLTWCGTAASRSTGARRAAPNSPPPTGHPRT